MEKSKGNESHSQFRKIFWPIETSELKKFIPMALMMFLILFNYSMLRSIKDGFVVTHIGAEAISFLKMYVVLPAAIVAMVTYAKLCNIMKTANVFYVVSLFFAAYFTFFIMSLYPNPEFFNPSDDKIASLVDNYPRFKWFIKIAGHWTYASFYTMSELWGSLMLSLLFWQFANQITKTTEAKRFYAMFGMLGNFGLILTGLIIGGSLSDESGGDKSSLGFEFVIGSTIVSALLLMLIYWWMQTYVLTDKRYYDPESVGPKKKKAKLGLVDSFKLIFSSKYLGLIALLVLSYGISINLVEGVWKAKAKLLFPTQESLTVFMGSLQMYTGIGTIVCMIIGNNILRLFSWTTAAILTPLMILVTGLAFFAFIFFDNVIGIYMAGILTSPPLVIAVTIGTIQNVLSKATKYSLFDPTKEMAYIPLDDELKSKGKAAVDVVGGRLGKSGGAIIQSTVFLLAPSMTFVEATPIFAAFFIAIVLFWIYAVRALGREYAKVVSE